MRKIYIAASIVFMMFTNANAEQITQKNLTLSDMKEALYGLLMDTRSNIEQINKLNKKFGRKVSSLSARLDNVEELTKKNAANIEKLYVLANKNSKKIKTLDKRNIVYKKEIQDFIDNNKKLLPQEK